ncbi:MULTISPECIES: DUF5085 family protein [Staphylococcus]|uniref:DUF5085 domain-containing protein n=2 Tax=Staphylococcus agnetis TaxID=985762 RepID=A0A2T4MHK3_9STAP|nr:MULTISPECIES: DUF5085 family protein [Staphylococcus]ALN77765.1 DUF5085 family protein [Staphylococcus agnetis]NHM92710.1 DUF5085 family protein [Staphylococcus sp. 10602379]NJI01427.1 DUF5085 family protein [Staphylococcus agnetis]NJI13110.1 DUF5085 family protein [Staphylococcus agnetis]OSP20275.1 DUF5085 domain-containing protein [Staphylococcus agnetis]
MNEISFDNMVFRDVAYKEYLDFSISNMDIYIKMFLNSIRNKGLEPIGPLIMAYTQIMKDQKVNVEFLMPVNGVFKSDMNLNFRSYLCIDEMLHGRLIGNDFEKGETQALLEIENFAKTNHLKRISPYYHIINNFNNYRWIDIKVKVRSY